MENRIIYGPTDDEDLYPIHGDLNIMVYNNLKNHGNRTALVDANTGEQYRFSDIFTSSSILAKNLKMKGIKNGDIISICSENRLEFSLCIPAMLYIGAVLAPVSWFFVKGELIHCLNILKPKVVICSEVGLKNITAVLENCSFIEELILISSSVPEINHNVRISLFSDLLKQHQSIDEEDAFAPVKLNPLTQTAVILFSSGTTGFPKGVELTHGNINSLLRTSRNKRGLNLNENSVVLTVSNFFYAVSFSHLIWSLAMGVKVIFLPKFTVSLLVSSIEKYKVNFLLIHPLVMTELAKSPLVDKHKLFSLKYVTSTSTFCGPNLANQVVSRLDGIYFRQAYGMTESLSVLIMTPFGSKKYDSIGKLVLDVQGKVTDLKTGEALGPIEVGELCFRGPQVMRGYYKNEEATREVIDSDGWLHSGDAGYYDSEGYFYIVDRLKEIMKYNGIQVAPAELECLLLSHSDIQDAAVVGKPDKESGSLPTAFVVKRPMSTITEKEIVEFVKDNVSPHKELRGGVIFVDAVPRNSSGKILRRVLRQWISDTK